MFSVTNPKVAGYPPCWPTVRGFTIFFGTLGQSDIPEGACLLLTITPTLIP